MSAINHVFVLMLENRSFDHMLGFSNLRGRDASSGQPTQIAGLQGNEENTHQGTAYRVKSPADFSMTVGPGHEFPDVLEQLSGTGAQYPTASKYPSITNSGFVENFVASGGQQDPGEVMKCFATGQLPVLTALANSFAICDNWFSSLPGPTWPNRFFLLAGTCSGQVLMPAGKEMLEPHWYTEQNQPTVFSRMTEKGKSWKIYHYDFPCSLVLTQQRNAENLAH